MFEYKRNIKQILCKNVLENNYCPYGNSCRFAHSLSEQILTKNKLLVYSIIEEQPDLSHIKIMDDLQLYSDLMIMTKECKKCISGKCNGGFNCSSGVCLKKYKICYKDLTTGNCKNVVYEDGKNSSIKSCIYGIHLTEKGFIPISIQNYCCNIVSQLENSGSSCYMLNDNNIEEVTKLLESSYT